MGGGDTADGDGEVGNIGKAFYEYENSNGNTR